MAKKVETPKNKRGSRRESVAELIASVSRPPAAWEPPAEFVEAVDDVLRHNHEQHNLRKRVGAPRLARWLGERKCQVGHTALGEYMARRAKVLGL